MCIIYSVWFWNCLIPETKCWVNYDCWYKCCSPSKYTHYSTVNVSVYMWSWVFVCECLHVLDKGVYNTFKQYNLDLKVEYKIFLAKPHLVLGLGLQYFSRVNFVIRHAFVMARFGARKSIQKLLRYFGLDKSRQQINIATILLARLKNNSLQNIIVHFKHSNSKCLIHHIIFLVV